MEIKAKLQYLRIAPRKVRLIADLVRGKTVSEARTVLNFSIKGASSPVMKLLNSAVANAKNNLGIEAENLYISKITVDEGPKIKRWQPRSRGQAFEIQRKTSHIKLVLQEINKSKIKKLKTKKVKSKDLKEVKKTEKTEKTEKKEKIKLRPTKEFKKPETNKIASRVFRRKAF